MGGGAERSGGRSAAPWSYCCSLRGKEPRREPLLGDPELRGLRKDAGGCGHEGDAETLRRAVVAEARSGEATVGEGLRWEKL